MKATEKQHAIRRIKTIADDLKRALTTLEKPELGTHLTAAIMDAKVTLRPCAAIVKDARACIAANSYGSRELKFRHVFAPPLSYHRALTAYEAEQKATEKRRNAIDREATRITDAIEFGKITDPAEAIAQMEQFRA